MRNDIPWQTLERFFANKTDAHESQNVKEWIDSADENIMIFEQLQQYYQAAGSLPIEFKPNTAAALKKVSARIPAKPKTFHLPSIWWKVAAVLLIGFSGWWFTHEHMKKQAPVIMAELKANASRLNIVLSDGSHVWLNAHSSIKYPKEFSETRNIYLNGEAYFEVAKDSKHPFVVHSANTQTKVLGTKFNVRSYPSDKQITVTVTEGKVGFGVVVDKQVLLTPNQKGTFDMQTGNIVKKENDNVNFMAWKTRKFYFDRQTLASVIETLADVYHFKYQLDNQTLKERVLTANFNNRPIDEIMQIISLSANVHVSLQNGTYTIK